MNKEKVYLEGYVVGHSADTLGYKGLLVQLENLDTVEIDENLVHKDINELRLLKLKDVIKRIEKFDLATKAVWINEILNKLGSDYGLHKYYAGYKQGKFDGAIEREKVIVPQFVADWIEVCKEHLTSSLYFAMTPSFLKANNQGVELTIWIKKNEETFARAWLDGYTVEEKRYLVKMKGISEDSDCLNYDSIDDEWYLASDIDGCNVRTHHTRKELEEAGFGEVFNSPLFEVEEVE